MEIINDLVQSWTAKLNSNEKIDIHPQFYADGLSDDLRALKKQLVTEFINDLVSICNKAA